MKVFKTWALYQYLELMYYFVRHKRTILAAELNVNWMQGVLYRLITFESSELAAHPEARAQLIIEHALQAGDALWHAGSLNELLMPKVINLSLQHALLVLKPNFSRFWALVQALLLMVSVYELLLIWDDIMFYGRICVTWALHHIQGGL